MYSNKVIIDLYFELNWDDVDWIIKFYISV